MATSPGELFSLCTETFGKKCSILNSRPIYCSQHYSNWAQFFQFFMGNFLFSLNCSICTKKLHNISFIKNNIIFFLNSLGGQNRLVDNDFTHMSKVVTYGVTSDSKNVQAEDWVYCAPSTFECPNLNLHNSNNFSLHL